MKKLFVALLPLFCCALCACGSNPDDMLNGSWICGVNNDKIQVDINSDKKVAKIDLADGVSMELTYSIVKIEGESLFVKPADKKGEGNQILITFMNEQQFIAVEPEATVKTPVTCNRKK